MWKGEDFTDHSIIRQPKVYQGELIFELDYTGGATRFSYQTDPCGLIINKE